MRLRFTTATLAVGAVAGLHPAAGQCPHDGPPARTVVLEARWVTVPDDLCKKHIATLPASATGTGGPAGVRFCDDAQLKQVLAAFQADRRVSILAAPKMTAEDGKAMTVETGEQHQFVTALKAVRVQGQNVCVPQNEAVAVGTRLTVTPHVSGNGRNVTLEIDARRRTLGECELVPLTTPVMPVFEGGSQGQPIPFTQFLQVPRVNEQALRVTAGFSLGEHVVIPGPAETREVRTEFGVPVLSDIPYVSRLFKNVGVGRVAERTVLIVSPRVVACGVAEPPPPAAVAPPRVAVRVGDPVHVQWQARPTQLPDPTNGGKMCPGLTGELYAFKQGAMQAPTHGTLTVTMCDLRDRCLEKWVFDPAALKRLVTSHGHHGHTVALFLPLPGHDPKVGTVKLTAEFTPVGGAAQVIPETCIQLGPTPAYLAPPVAYPAAPPVLMPAPASPPPPVTVPMPGRLLPAAHAVPVTIPAPGGKDRGVEVLVKAYHLACLAGDKDAAMRYAVQALALDPTCFSPGK